MKLYRVEKTIVVYTLAASAEDAEEVRKRWPRAEVTCPDCGMDWLLYGSWEHMVRGGW